MYWKVDLKSLRTSNERQKKAIGDVFFNYLGYYAICTSGLQASGNRFFEAQWKEESMNHFKLLRLRKDSYSMEGRNFSYKRVADFDKIFDEDLVAGFRSQSAVGVERLFGNEAASRAYRMFKKFEVYDSNETSLLFIAYLETSIAAINLSFVEEQARGSTSNGNSCH